MITIKKGKEPASLTQFRAGGGKKFDDLDSETKNDIRDSLLKEQGYLCAYCMKQIGRNKKDRYKDVKIEHIIPRSLTQADPDPDVQMLEIDYNNLVAVCNGITKGETHCDTSKENRQINLNPCSAAVEQSISYATKDGTISSNNSQWNNDLDSAERLNLNHGSIKTHRVVALTSFLNHLKSEGKWSDTHLKRELEKLTDRSIYFPYLGILKYYLLRRLSRKK